MYTIDLFQYKSQFHNVFNVSPESQGSPITFLTPFSDTYFSLHEFLSFNTFLRQLYFHKIHSKCQAPFQLPSNSKESVQFPSVLYILHDKITQMFCLPKKSLPRICNRNAKNRHVYFLSPINFLAFWFLILNVFKIIVNHNKRKAVTSIPSYSILPLLIYNICC
jgi:hypothetical protein